VSDINRQSKTFKVPQYESYKKFRYKLLSIKNWLVISFTVLTFYIVMNGKVEFITFITAVDSIILAAYFAVNYGQDRLKEHRE